MSVTYLNTHFTYGKRNYLLIKRHPTSQLKARSHIETQLKSTVELSWVGSLSVSICDRGLRLEFWCFLRLISLVSNLEMSKI